MIPINDNLRKSPDDFAKLKENTDPRVQRHSLRHFYINPEERLEGMDWVVDFSQISSLPKMVFDEVLKRKVLQMDDRTRVKFKIRAGWYFRRINQDEIRDGLEDPWAEEQSA